MKVGIVILCRYTSRRLPGKILMKLHGRCVLQHIVDRVRQADPNYPMVVATSNDSSDEPIIRYCVEHDIPFVRGSLQNVADRFLTAADFLGVDYAVRINGDNVLLDGTVLNQIVQIAATGLYDFVTNVPGRTFPFGMSVEAVSVDYYRRIVRYFTDASDKEHVTKYIYDHPDEGSRFVYKNTACPRAVGLQLALDTGDDFARIESILDHLGEGASSAPLAYVADIAQALDRPDPWKGKHGPLLIAEIGGNHEGDYDSARRMTALAVDCQVDYVKFQLYRGDTLVNPLESPDRNRHFQKFELTKDQHLELAQMCRDGGVGYMASVWDLSFLDWIDDFIPIYKIGSGDLTARPVVREFALRGKPMIVATGLSTLAEVLEEVAFIQSVNSVFTDDRMLALLQCTSMYPIPDGEANLAVMQTLHAATGLTVGYSDHTEGDLALRVAASLGARILEFHFTDRREGQAFRDHRVSLLPEGVRALQYDLDRIQPLTGDGIK
ncbi:MAG: N-acetylneuraminate synthase family protein, partial [Kiritimatiellae bacterium]|nr:N-acetylneuraminate synthase family protein [Kiritimatiellia bacterium]